MRPEFVCLNRKGDAVMYLPIPGPQPCPSVGGGDVISMDKHGQNFASADIARIRLRDVVARDRAAVPCGRWVKTGRQFSKLPNDELLPIAVLARIFYDRRMRYRWEARR